MGDRPRLTSALHLTLGAFRRHNASRFGAALAFYIIFCIAPALLIIIALTGLLFGRSVTQQQILDRIGGSVGSAAGSAIAGMIRDAAAPGRGWIATILGFTSLYFGLSGVYRQIADALRTIWQDVPMTESSTQARPVEKSAPSVLLVLATGFILLLSIAADAAIAVTGNYASNRLLGGDVFWLTAQVIISTLVLTALFAFVFRTLARSRVMWRDVAPGALVTAVLFVAGKSGLALYLREAGVGSAFGAAGSIVVVLLWSYWSAEIFFFGLEFTHVYAQYDA